MIKLIFGPQHDKILDHEEDKYIIDIDGIKYIYINTGYKDNFNNKLYQYVMKEH